MPCTDGLALITDEEVLVIILERMLDNLDVNNGIGDLRREIKVTIEEILNAGFKRTARNNHTTPKRHKGSKRA